MMVAVTGASGFIGKRLVDDLIAHTDYLVVAISRSGAGLDHPRVIRRKADFFSLYSAETALSDCDVAFYLLHSMIPSHRLSQGHFEDFDFILADNFARAARKAQLGQIIYVGGMIDEGDTSLSRHLKSRKEVEGVLSSKGTPATVVRCSLVIGSEGSSFAILRNLVTRLPFMLLPSWCNSDCQPVALDDLILVLRRCINNAAVFDRSIDVGVPERISYRALIETTARMVTASPVLIDVPAIPMVLSKLWIQLIAGASRSLVYPLVDSLVHDMVVRQGHEAGRDLIECYIPVARAIEIALAEPRPKPQRLVARLSRGALQRNLVQSVQRLPLPPQCDAFKVAQYYFRWLSRFFTHVLVVKNHGQLSSFQLFGRGTALLELTFCPERSARDRQLFYITGGLLARSSARARLEFRESPDCQFVFAAIHDYSPSLPWWLYRTTQALVHRFVMWRFARFLTRAGTRHTDVQPTSVS